MVDLAEAPVVPARDHPEAGGVSGAGKPLKAAAPEAVAAEAVAAGPTAAAAPAAAARDDDAASAAAADRGPAVDDTAARTAFDTMTEFQYDIGNHGFFLPKEYFDAKNEGYHDLPYSWPPS